MQRILYGITEGEREKALTISLIYVCNYQKEDFKKAKELYTAQDFEFKLISENAALIFCGGRSSFWDLALLLLVSEKLNSWMWAKMKMLGQWTWVKKI